MATNEADCLAIYEARPPDPGGVTICNSFALIHPGPLPAPLHL